MQFDSHLPSQSKFEEPKLISPRYDMVLDFGKDGKDA